MIIKNEFPEYEDVVKEVHDKMFSPNIMVVRSGKSRILGRKVEMKPYEDKDLFRTMLMHEVGHIVCYPSTIYNFFDDIYRFINANYSKYGLAFSTEEATLAIKVAVDIVNEYMISKLGYSKYMVKGYGKYKCYNRMCLFLVAIFLKIHGDNSLLSMLSKKEEILVEEIVAVLEKYDVKTAVQIIANLLINPISENLEEARKAVNTEEIGFTEEEVKTVVQKILEESKSFEEAKKKINILNGALGAIGAKVYFKPGHRLCGLKDFYDAKAYKNIRMILPKTKVTGKIDVGSKEWEWENIENLDIERTIEDHALPIPPLLQPMSLPFRVGVQKKKPEIMIHIDTSGSTGTPNGSMKEVIDHEIVASYSLINMAKINGYKVGASLWSWSIYFLEEPSIKYDELKQEILVRIRSGGMTVIDQVFNYIFQNRRQIHLILTDAMCSMTRFAVEKVKPLRNWVVLAYSTGEEHKFNEIVREYWSPFGLEDRLVYVGDYTNLSHKALEVYLKMVG